MGPSAGNQRRRHNAAEQVDRRGKKLRKGGIARPARGAPPEARRIGFYLRFRDDSELLVALSDTVLPMSSPPPYEITEQAELLLKLWNETQ